MAMSAMNRSLGKRRISGDDWSHNKAKRRHLEEPEEDKENTFNPLCRSTPQSNKRSVLAKSEAAKTPWSLRKLLTPIREDKVLDQSSINVPCLPVAFKAATAKGSELLRKGSLKKRSEKSQKVAARLDSYFLSPNRLNGGYVNLDMTDDCNEPFLYPLDVVEKEVSAGSPGSDPPSSGHVTLSDVSHISNGWSPHEQVSTANLTGAFHSTFNYPLHSTFNYPVVGGAAECQISACEAPETPARKACDGHETRSVLEAAKDSHLGKSCSTKDTKCSCDFDDSDSDSCWSDSDVTEIDVDDFSSCDSSYLSDVCQDVTMATSTRHYGNNSRCTNNSRMMRRQSGLAELSSRSPPVGAAELSMRSVRPGDVSSRLVAGQDTSGLSDVWIIKDECNSFTRCSTRSRLHVLDDSSDWSEQSSDLSARYRFEALKITSPYCTRSSKLSASQARPTSRGLSTTMPAPRITRKLRKQKHKKHQPQQNGHGARKVSSDSGCSMNSSGSSGYTISDNTGQQRTIQHDHSTSVTVSTSSKTRKKSTLAERLQHFSKSFTKTRSSMKSKKSSKGHTSLHMEYGIRV